jgi:hypothetical protein
VTTKAMERQIKPGERDRGRWTAAAGSLLLDDTKKPQPYGEKAGASEAEGGGSAVHIAACRVQTVHGAGCGCGQPGRPGEASRNLLAGGRRRRRATSQLSCTVVCMRSRRSVSLFLFYITNRLILYVIYLRKCGGSAGYSYIRDEAAYCPRSD